MAKKKRRKVYAHIHRYTKARLLHKYTIHTARLYNNTNNAFTDDGDVVFGNVVLVACFVIVQIWIKQKQNKRIYEEQEEEN